MKTAEGKRMVSPDAAKNALRNQRGQTVVLFALCVFVFVCFLAFMVNVGQLVHNRILTQAAADMVALSVATVQAAGLNEIADLNYEHRSLQEEMTEWLQWTWFFQSAGEIDRLWEYFESRLMQTVQRYKDLVNGSFPAYARLSAYGTLAALNAEYGGFSLERLDISGSAGRLVSLTDTPSRRIRAMYVQRSPYGAYLPVFRVAHTRRLPVRPGGMQKGFPRSHARSLRLPYERKSSSRGDVYVVAGVAREEAGSLINLPSLGFDVKIPRMRAISAAMPTGGDIESGRARYFARFVPLEAVGYGGYHH